MHQSSIARLQERIFKPSLDTSFARHFYALLSLGILWSVSLLAGITLQVHGQSIAGINHHGFYALSCLILVILLGQIRNTYRAYSRMLDGHAELDESDTLHIHDRPLSA